VRNEHWKGHPAKPHDAAAHVDREDDRAPANNVPRTKRLQTPLLDDVRYQRRRRKAKTTDHGRLPTGRFQPTPIADGNVAMWWLADVRSVEKLTQSEDKPARETSDYRHGEKQRKKLDTLVSIADHSCSPTRQAFAHNADDQKRHPYEQQEPNSEDVANDAVEAVWVAGFPHGANHTGRTYIRNWTTADWRL
jgi:hypothetical protein